MRASDDEREHVATALAAHAAAGRLEVDELDERVATAYAATTRDELDALLADLPRAPAAPARAGGGERRKPVLWGDRPFEERVDLDAPRERVFDLLLETIAPALARADFHLAQTERPQLLRFTREGTSSWGRLAAVLTLGLLAFALRREATFSILLTPLPSGGTRLHAFGEAPRSVRRAFVELGD